MRLAVPLVRRAMLIAAKRPALTATRAFGPKPPSRAPRGLFRALATGMARPSTADVADYIKDVAAADPPAELDVLLRVLEAQGGQLVRPSDRKSLHPLVVPLSRDAGGGTTALLRWPTPPDKLGLQVVRCGPHGLELLGASAAQFVARALATEDATAGATPVAAAAGDAGRALYAPGAFAASGGGRLAVYLTKHVGKFPDVLESLAESHLTRGDELSALVAGEWYVRTAPAGWGRACAYNAALLSRVGRAAEARDAARVAFRSPWWTLGLPYADLAALAGFGDKPVEWVQSRLTDEAAAADIQSGKAPQQVALDTAALLMDRVASGVDGGDWDAARGELEAKYSAAGLPEIARFIAEGGR